MKKLAILPLLLTLLLTGCGTETAPELNTGTNQTSSVQDVLDQATAAPEPTNPVLTAPPAPTVERPPVPEGFGSFESVDIDLTAMNAIMVYTQVYDMVSNPQDYVGKTVKMNGLFGYYHETSIDEYYYAVVIEDATACCAQGIEFITADHETRTFPDGYPEAGDITTVVGVFSTYFPEEIPDLEYPRLEQAEFITD